MNYSKQNGTSLDSSINTSGVDPSESPASSSANLDVGSYHSDQLTLNKSFPRLLPHDLLEADPPTDDEIFLHEIHPDLGQLLSRLKSVSSVSGVSSEFVEPILDHLKITGKLCENLQDQADAVTERAEPVVIYFNEVAKKLEEELTSILGVFGMGLPTEPWHVDSIAAVIKDIKREKNKRKKQ